MILKEKILDLREKMSKTYVIDIDGTICNTNGMDYENSIPIFSRIEKINSLYDSGDKIIFLTARGMGRNDNSYKMAYEQFYKMTYNQLVSWGCKFHQLLLGKPAGDYYIDDKAINDLDFFK